MYLIDKNGYDLIIEEETIKYTSYDKFYMYDFEDTHEISRSDFLKSKYGPLNKHCDLISHSVAKFSDGCFVTVSYRDQNIVRIHSDDGKVINVVEAIRPKCGVGIYGITVDSEDMVWIVAPTEHYAGRFDRTGKLIFEITADSKMEPTLLSYPEEITFNGSHVFISDMGNRRIAKLDIVTYSIESYLKVSEEVYQFEIGDEFEFYQLRSGLYYSEKGKEVRVKRRYLP